MTVLPLKPATVWLILVANKGFYSLTYPANNPKMRWRAPFTYSKLNSSKSLEQSISPALLNISTRYFAPAGKL